MRCVSYTRALSGCWAIEPKEDMLKKQNALITEYAKKRGWKITQKYSDRKKVRDEETAFLQMKQDGINRKYDCILFGSIFYAGRNYTSTYDLIYLILYPAGVHFAVAEDDFCSADKTKDEVEAYLQKNRSVYRGEIASILATRQCKGRQYMKYGYVWKDDDTLEVDEIAAQIIREIFEMCRDGSSMLTISKSLQERGIDTPFQYAYKKFDKDCGERHKNWNAARVKNILANEMYIGKWKRCIRGIDYEYPCPVIVDQTLFDAAQQGLHKRNNVKNGRSNSEYSWYSGIIVDEETQHPLMSYIKPSDKEHILRFRYPAPQVKRYQQLWIKVDTVTESAKKMLFCEVQKARRVKQLLETELCEKEKAAQLEQLRKKAIAVFAKMSAVEKELMQYSKRYEAGELTEEDYSEQYQSSLLKQNEMNATLQTHMTAMEEVETVFSSKNPWLELYANLQIGEHFDKRELKKYISKVLVYRFETASVEFIHVKWRDRLPKLWLEETR